MTKPVKDYYTNLSKFICHQKNTSFLNLTNDYAIAYICENKNIHFEKNLSPFMAKYFKKNEYKRILIEQKLEKNELLFFDKKLINPKNLELIKIFETPHNPKEWYGDIYVYKKF